MALGSGDGLRRECARVRTCWAASPTPTCPAASPTPTCPAVRLAAKGLGVDDDDEAPAARGVEPVAL